MVSWLRAHLLRGLRRAVVWETGEFFDGTKWSLTFVENKRLGK